MFEQNISSEERMIIIAFLSELELFKKLNSVELEELIASLTWVYLEGGEALIRQGELDSTLYILFQGRLRVYIQNSTSQVHIAEISVGQLVGEIAFLTDQPRTGTVRAIRDSIVLKLDKEHFTQFERSYPTAVAEMAKTAIRRLLSKPRPTEAGENIITIAIAPSGNSDHHAFIPRFVQELNQVKSALLVNEEICNRHFNKHISQSTWEDPDNNLMTKWLQSLENQYDYIIYETSKTMCPWTQRCLRQADKVFLVAQDWLDPALNSIETYLFSGEWTILPYIELVLIHSDQTTKIVGTHQWLAMRQVYGYHHLRMGYQEDFAKFIRFLTGQAFGVVLNGGGARGFIHAGVLKAIEKLGIPIDFIAGSSAGANAAASYALGLVSQVLELTQLYIHYPRDYTLPLVSLLSGKKNSEFYQMICGDTCIEDLWTRFFCVSTNITQSTLHVHDRGLLWFALRASTSVPGIYPPVYDEEGNMLVDGGILNNMPVDVMRKLICGGKILAINCHSYAGEQTKRNIKETWVSGWKLLLQKFNPFRHKNTESYDNIFKIIVTSVSLGSFEHQNLMEQEADYLLRFDTSQYGFLEFKAGQELINLGYRLTLERLPELLKKHH